MKTQPATSTRIHAIKCPVCGRRKSCGCSRRKFQSVITKLLRRWMAAKQA